MKLMSLFTGRCEGHLDILFSNAAIYELVPLGSIIVLNINVKRVLFTVQKSLLILNLSVCFS